MHNFFKMDDERARRCETSTSDGSNASANKWGTGDFDERVREAKTCQKLASAEEIIGKFGEI
jgi:hypothetical protein